GFFVYSDIHILLQSGYIQICCVGTPGKDGQCNLWSETPGPRPAVEQIIQLPAGITVTASQRNPREECCTSCADIRVSCAKVVFSLQNIGALQQHIGSDCCRQIGNHDFFK